MEYIPEVKMAKKQLPVVSSTTTSNRPAMLRYQAEGEWVTLEVGSPEWFLWLAEGHPFRMVFWNLDGEVQFERSKEAQGWYWRGWKSIGGKTRKKYIGPTLKVSQARLDQVGQFFLETLQARRQQAPDLPVGWDKLRPHQKEQVEAYIAELLANI
jgi:hypothetical protein